MQKGQAVLFAGAGISWKAIGFGELYINYAETHARLLDKLSELLQNNTVLFVGYGLHDEYVRHLLSQIRRKQQQWTPKAFAVGFYDEVRKKLLASRQIEAINADADEFLTELSVQAGLN